MTACFGTVQQNNTCFETPHDFQDGSDNNKDRMNNFGTRDDIYIYNIYVYIIISMYNYIQ